MCFLGRLDVSVRHVLLGLVCFDGHSGTCLVLSGRELPRFALKRSTLNSYYLNNPFLCVYHPTRGFRRQLNSSRHLHIGGVPLDLAALVRSRLELHLCWLL